MNLKVLAMMAVAATLSGCYVPPAPGYYAAAPARAYTYYTYDNCPYYYETPQGPVCARSHPQYGYVYSGGPGVAVGVPVPVGFHINIGGGHGGWRHWGRR